MSDELYPFEPGDHLSAAALNAAIAAGSSDVPGPTGPAGTSFLSGTGAPTATAPVGSTYLDVANGDIWTFS